ncbi:MAG TPA: hypothetical protein DEF04_06815, partial [Clostridiales bacterium]|nr:hypothetical protein [Clostridiales bacterium]
MKKKILKNSLMSFMLVCVILLSTASPVFAAWGLPVSVDIKVDDNQTQTLYGYTVEGYDFYSLDDIAYILKGSSKKFDIQKNSDGSIELLKNTDFSEVDYTLCTSGVIRTGDVSFITKSYTIDARKIIYSIAVVDGEIYMRLSDVFQIF